ncbi:MAG: SGNH/GDSL hydrolase family protein [Tatlockia sp.]|jgi:lysophospholipase L1-like esterase
MQNVKHILCYGDSLTWGFDPDSMNRYPFEVRWTGLLQNTLGASYRIIEEGLNGRTTAFDDPFSPHRNGSTTLPFLLETHAPVDLVVLMLGTNDVKEYIHGNAKKAAIGCGKLIWLISASKTNLGGKASEILLVSPPHIINPPDFMETLFEGAAEESKKLACEYKSVANYFKAHFMDTSLFIKPCATDGVHLDEENNKLLAEKMAEKVREIVD